jgi:hypothetical protein
MLVQAQVVGPQVNLPGSQQLAPAFFAIFAVGSAVALVISLLVRRARNRDGHRSFPVVSTALVIATVGAIVMAVLSWPPQFRSPEFPPTGRLFPSEAFFYRTATDLPVAADSDRWLASMGDDTLVAGFGGEPVDGVVFGVPFNLVDADAPTTSVEMRGDPARSYTGPYPISDPAYIESMPTYGFDNHYVALDQDARSMWELIGVTVWFGRWQADAGARWDLDSLSFGGPATTASRLPLLPGTLTYDEVVAGRVDHVVWAGAPTLSSSRFVWPALATDGLSDSADAPPMGAWLRLRADADLEGLGPQARVIAEGLQTHGMIMSDTSNQRFGLRGTPDGRWDRADLGSLGRFTAADFEVVDPSGVMVAPDSMAALPPGG